jgi:hypothetical protein
LPRHLRTKTVPSVWNIVLNSPPTEILEEKEEYMVFWVLTPVVKRILAVSGEFIASIFRAEDQAK